MFLVELLFQYRRYTFLFHLLVYFCSLACFSDALFTPLTSDLVTRRHHTHPVLRLGCVPVSVPFAVVPPMTLGRTNATFPFRATSMLGSIWPLNTTCRQRTWRVPTRTDTDPNDGVASKRPKKYARSVSPCIPDIWVIN